MPPGHITKQKELRHLQLQPTLTTSPVNKMSSSSSTSRFDSGDKACSPCAATMDTRTTGRVNTTPAKQTRSTTPRKIRKAPSAGAATSSPTSTRKKLLTTAAGLFFSTTAGTTAAPAKAPGAGPTEGINSRILMIPDIHGDYELMQQALSFVYPIDKDHDQLIFTGDFVDRGPQPRECYELSQVLADNYNVTRLTGNHEWVTIQGVGQHDPFAMYVPEEDLKSFGTWPERQHAFSKDGHFGKMIRRKFDVIALLGIDSDPMSKTLFVHAGISIRTMQQWGTVEAIKKAGREMLQSDYLDTVLLNEILQTRHLAQGPDSRVCMEVRQILKVAKAERLVVGHTPTPLIGGQPGEPIVKCKGRFILMDVAMSRWMGGGMPAALIIETDANTGKLSRVFYKIKAGEEHDVPLPETSLQDTKDGDDLRQEL
ncbi:unnamed protein product [Amoebophrya sp. A120]|nr:unnamed protein product [Amoebophrya sp. A120]|eukprot:GSA120T00006747001.1